MLQRCSKLVFPLQIFRGVTPNPILLGAFPVKLYKPGDLIPYSGTYRVIHHEHLHAHEVTCISGERFPACRQCRAQVRFALLSAARSIRKHAMFAADQGGARAGNPRAHDLLENNSDPIGDSLPPENK